MLYLTEQDVAAVLDMTLAIEAVEAALVAKARLAAIDVPRERTRTPQGILHILQGAAPDIDVIGYKAYYATPHGTRSYVQLYRASDGRPLAMLESNAFNVVRTGAASAVATRALARSDARTVGQIGAGRQGEGQLEGVCAVRPIEHARVFARTRERLEAFCRTMSDRLGIPVEPAGSAAQAVAGAAIVNVITKSAAPVLAGASLEPGQHVNAAGSNALSRREIDAAVVERADLIAVDSRETAERECGDLLPLVESGRLRWQALAEIGEVVAGLRPGRPRSDAITLYESHGMALQDLYVATRVLERARARGLGGEVGSG